MLINIKPKTPNGWFIPRLSLTGGKNKISAKKIKFGIPRKSKNFYSNNSKTAEKKKKKSAPTCMICSLKNYDLQFSM